MKNLLLLFNLLMFSLSAAQTNEETVDFSKSKTGQVKTEVEVKTRKGEKFKYDFVTAQFSSEEIQQIFLIPDSIASKFPMQVIYLKHFTNIDNVSLNDIIGISTFSINPEMIKHRFFRNEKANWKADEMYRTTFNNNIYCSFYESIFALEISQTSFLDNNPAYFLIYNKDIHFETKNKQEKFLSEGYFATLGMPDHKNHLFLKLKKQAATLGFKHKILTEKQDISTP